MEKTLVKITVDGENGSPIAAVAMCKCETAIELIATYQAVVSIKEKLKERMLRTVKPEHQDKLIKKIFALDLPDRKNVPTEMKDIMSKLQDMDTDEKKHLIKDFVGLMKGR